ncbi:MAG: conserved exported protein of unknown function [Xanthobacteraceae bacterium]|nr:MAG: conserved exported protein of unknown function [Xanthobacteraceae bacterium]
MPGISRRTATLGLASAGLLATGARAQGTYPGNQTIRIIVPFAAGGTTDVTGRTLAERLSVMWGTSVIVENVPGGGTNIGIDRVAKSAPDGTTLGIIVPSLAINPFLMARMPYDPEKDIQPISLTVRIPNLLVVRNNLPVNSVAELIAYLKANPGKLNFASAGVGSTIHLSGEIFKKMAGVEMTHVPYRGAGPAVNDLVGGQVDLMFADIPTVINLVRGGQLKGLGVTLGQRYSLTPEFPSIAETVPGYDVFSYFGVGVRTGTPEAIVRKLEADCIAVAKDPAVKARLAALSAEVVGSTAAEFAQLYRVEREKWGKLITELKLKIE